MLTLSQYTDMIIFSFVLRYHGKAFLFAAPPTISSPVFSGVKPNPSLFQSIKTNKANPTLQTQHQYNFNLNQPKTCK